MEISQSPKDRPVLPRDGWPLSAGTACADIRVHRKGQNHPLSTPSPWRSSSRIGKHHDGSENRIRRVREGAVHSQHTPCSQTDHDRMVLVGFDDPNTAEAKGVQPLHQEIVVKQFLLRLVQYSHFVYG